MGKSVQGLSALLVLQLALVALMWWRSEGHDETSKSALLNFSVATAQALTIESGDSNVTLARTDTGWVLSASGLPVDANRISSVLAQLSSAQGGWPVAATEDASERFQLGEAAPAKRVTLEHSGGSETLLVGSSSGIKKVYARLPGEQAIYNISLDSFNLSAQPADWLDKTLLRPQGELLRLQGQDFTLIQSAQTQDAEPQWDLLGITETESLDQDKLQRFLSAIRNLRVSAVAEQMLTGEPAGRILLGLPESELRWELFHQGDTWQLQSSANPTRFVLAPATAEILAWHRGDLLSVSVSVSDTPSSE